MATKMSVQAMIQTLQNFWADKGCMLMQAYDTEKGAGTMSLIPSCVPSDQNLGMRLTWNLLAVPLMVVMVKTLTGCINTINSKL